MKEIEQKFEDVRVIVEKYDCSHLKPVPILQEVQELYKYLPEEVMTYLAMKLNISPAKVYGVATFYSHFALEPKGKNLIKICDGTACHVKNSTGILEAITKRLDLVHGKNTTPDGLFTLEMVSCLGACGLAPAVVINDKVYGPMTGESTLVLIEELIKAEKEASVNE